MSDITVAVLASLPQNYVIITSR